MGISQEMPYTEPSLFIVQEEVSFLPHCKADPKLMFSLDTR